MPDEAKFSVLRKACRVWAVASIHGDAERLERVHAEVVRRFRRGDRLVYLGNYLGRGRQVCTVLDELLLFRRTLIARPGMFASDVAFLRGAQEEMWTKLLQIHLALNPIEVLEWMLERGVGATLAAYGFRPSSGLERARAGAVELARWTSAVRAAMQAHAGHYALMTALRRAAFTDDGGLLFVHAGLDRDRPLDAQGDTLWWGGGGFDTMTEPYDGFRMVVRGFDRAGRGLQISPYAATLDGGCGFGGPLHAACFDPAGQLVDLVEG